MENSLEDTPAWSLQLRCYAEKNSPPTLQLYLHRHPSAPFRVASWQAHPYFDSWQMADVQAVIARQMFMRITVQETLPTHMR